MKKNNESYLFLILLFVSILFFNVKSFAIENTFFLSLKNNEVNLRLGPAF